MAMIVSVPARILLFGVNIKLLLLQLFVSSVFLFITVIVWKRGLKQYESASS